MGKPDPNSGEPLNINIYFFASSLKFLLFTIAVITVIDRRKGLLTWFLVESYVFSIPERVKNHLSLVFGPMRI